MQPHREWFSDPAANHPGITIWRNKGYIGEAHTQQIHSQGICLVVSKNPIAKITGQSSTTDNLPFTPPMGGTIFLKLVNS